MFEFHYYERYDSGSINKLGTTKDLHNTTFTVAVYCSCIGLPDIIALYT